MTQPIESKSARIHYLDSIRGIAAMMVVVMHFIGWKWNETLQFKLANIIFNGTEAVSFFFVLSGFVLSYSYLNSSRKINFAKYSYKRILRLYPAYIINILALFVYKYRGESISGIVDQLTTNLPYKELLMFQKTHALYLPGWTLRIEIIYSFIIIGLILLYRRSPYLLLIPLIACYFVGPLDLRVYINHFTFGILLSALYPKIKDLSFKDSKLYPWRWPLYVTMLLLFSLVPLRKFFPAIGQVMDTLWPHGIRWAHFSGIAAFLFLIVVILSKPLQKLFEKDLLIYLGKISYSIYLVHWGICIFIMDYWHVWGRYLGEGPLRFCFMFIVFIGASVLAADLMYRFVEEPFIRLSKRGWK